jgi:translation initiation factor IF-3
VTQDGNNLGILPIDQAQGIADQSGLDLVEVVPNANPPVCSIMDFGKYRFEQKKKIKDQQHKSKAVAPKAIRLRPVSNDHDIETKINQLKKFLSEKRPVVVNIIFKKRELMFKDQGIKVMEKVVAAVEGIAKVESQPRLEGKTLSVRLQPK